jgi:putative membrane protein
LLEGFFDPGGEDALVSAIKAVEAASSAEVVVVIRRSSGSYRDARAIVGAAFGVATLAFGLFSPWPFPNLSLFVDPVLVGLAAALLTAYVPPLARVVTSRAERDRRVDVHARALFVERGVGNTTGRTGVLVYVSLLERTSRLVADSGVTAKVPAAAWSARVNDVERATHRMKATAVASALRELGPVLGECLPCSPDDVNELPDEVVAP